MRENTYSTGNPGVVSVTDDPATGFRTRNYDATFSAVTGTAGLQWSPTEDVMAYAKYSRGYKAGGFRIGIDTSLGAFPDIYSWSVYSCFNG